MSCDLAIVGRGFWGVAAALLARHAGLEVLVIDAERGESASRAAAGYFAHSWWKGIWRQRMAQALETAEFYGVDIRRPGEKIVNRGGKLVHDWYCFDPAQFLGLVPADRCESVGTVGAGFVAWPGHRIHAKHVLVAAGARTDTLLKASGIAPLGVTDLPGCAAIYRGRPPDMPWRHQVNPFFAYHMREWSGGRIRGGETLEKVPGRASTYFDKLRDKLEPYEQAQGWKLDEVVRGIRPVLKDGPKVVEVAKGVYAATGGGRTGAIQSFWGARKLLDLIGVTEP